MITIYGASGHAKVVIDIIKSNDDSVIEVIDDNASIISIMGHTVNIPEDKNYKEVIVAIGNNLIRRRIVENIKASYSKAIIHKTACIGSEVSIDIGTVIMARSIINAAVVIGKHCIINSGSIIEHDVRLGDYVHISPGAIVTGGVIVGEGSHVGAGAVILPNVKIGKDVIVGAGAIVISDVDDNTVVIGNPARILRKNIKNNE